MRRHRARPHKKTFIHDLEDRERRRAGDRIAGKGTAEAAGLGRVHDLGPPDHRRQWKAAAKRFRDRDDVRLEIVMLAGKKSPGTAESGLDLIGNQNDAVLASDACQLFEEACGRRHEAAFTEDRFDDDGGDPIGRDHAFKELVERRQRILRGNAVPFEWERGVINLAAKGTEVLLIRRILAGHGKRQQRASVITVREGDDGRTARILARNLDRVLGRFRPGRQQQRLFGSRAGRSPVELFGHAKIRLVHCDLKTGVSETGSLFGDRRDDFRMCMAGVERADSAGKVEVAMPVAVP